VKITGKGWLVLAISARCSCFSRFHSGAFLPRLGEEFHSHISTTFTRVGVHETDTEQR
jgi:hypothetical protein